MLAPENRTWFDFSLLRRRNLMPTSRGAALIGKQTTALNSLFESRPTQVDFRFSRIFRRGGVLLSARLLRVGAQLDF
jgi:hypothetical protein